MKRVLSIVVLCVVLFTMSGLSAFASVQDVIPPVVYAVGFSPTSMEIKGCPGNAPVGIQAKVTDVGGIQQVWAEVKAPGGRVLTYDMTLVAGYWRVWVPKTVFAVKGAWQIRVGAEDWRTDPAPNRTYSAWKTLTLSVCDRIPPTVGVPTWTPNELVASWCAGPHNVLIQVDAWDASGIKKVELWYQAPTSADWSVTPMTRYSNNGYQAVIGNWPDGSMMFEVRAFDPFNHTTTTDEYEVVVTDPCGP